MKLDRDWTEMNVPDTYRGVKVPKRLRQYWDKPTGKWWRAGVDAKGDTLPFEVLPGQVYADNDYRLTGRTLRIDHITDDGVYAVCTVLSNYSHVQKELDQGNYRYADMRGTQTAIKVHRFSHAHARGYRLVEEPKAS